jgi:hypothetical protein
MYRRNADFRLRQLARLASQGDIAARDQAFRQLIRAGHVSPNVLYLLAMAGYGDVTFDPPERFSLAFCSTFTSQDESGLIERENTRIQYLRGIDEKFLLFKIMLELLRVVSQKIFDQNPQIFEILFKKIRRKKWLSFKEFRGRIYESLAYLNSISPFQPPIPEEVEEWIVFFRFWSMATSMDGDMTSNVFPDGQDEDYYELTSDTRAALYTLTETFRHIFLSLAGKDTDDDPCQGPFFRDTIYGGDHGLLNPHCHYAGFYEGVLRISELTDEAGKIDWYVVYSNVISGCYLSWGAIQSADSDEVLEDLDVAYEEADELRAERLNFLDESSGLETQMETMEEEIEPLLEQQFAREEQLMDDDFDYDNQEELLQADPQWAALEVQIAPIQSAIAVLNAERDALIEGDIAYQELNAQANELGEKLERAQAVDTANWREILENQFWEILAEAIINTSTSYYISRI